MFEVGEVYTTTAVRTYTAHMGVSDRETNLAQGLAPRLLVHGGERGAVRL